MEIIITCSDENRGSKDIYGKPIQELIRCDECRWCKVDGGFRHCMMSAIVHPTADDYCSLGERKDAKTD
jgi:hypothetical protein